MTNGEKIKEIFPNIGSNGISNRSIIYKAKKSKEIQEDLAKLSELNEPTTKIDECRGNNKNK